MNKVMKHICAVLLSVSCITACSTEEMNGSDVKGVDVNSGPFLHDITFLSSHNAFVNRGDTSFLVANQGRLSLETQLRGGVRSLMLDVYNYDGTATLCHTSCANIPTVFPRSSFADSLREIAKFAKDNRNEIITIHLEDYLNKQAPGFVGTIAETVGLGRFLPKKEINAAATLEKALNESGIRDLIFNPYDDAYKVQERGWPRINRMVQDNKRILILSSLNYGDKKKALGVAFDQDFLVENYWSMGSATANPNRECRNRWDHIPLNKKGERFQRLFLMNHFRDIPVPFVVANDNAYDFLMSRVKNECMRAAGRKPNFIAIDRVQTGDGMRVVRELNGQR